MDSDDHNKGSLMRHDMRVTSLILGSVYLLIGMVQILVSFKIINDPTGAIGNDPVSGGVLIIISLVFFGGAFKGKDRAEESRSHAFVGVILGILYGLTGFLIGISKVLSEMMGAGEGGDPTSGFLDPSVIMFYILSISVLLFWSSRSHGRRRRRRH